MEVVCAPEGLAEGCATISSVWRYCCTGTGIDEREREVEVITNKKCITRIPKCALKYLAPARKRYNSALQRTATSAPQTQPRRLGLLGSLVLSPTHTRAPGHATSLAFVF